MFGAEVGIVVSSPTGKAFSFWHLSVLAITNKFLNRNISLAIYMTGCNPCLIANERVRMDRNNGFINRLLTPLDAKKEREKALSSITRATIKGHSSNMELVKGVAPTNLASN
ncbi:hypothetical protein CDL15_Pgr026614 [Punica granatum]|uniref:Uncharacterized protein n=1 Tax=Punica granatum TaxID=22663 RepID=A0A218WMQ1_PUNGR|nr:hypothetical protein CDL15_Pgr026610 [Punica granatum]OWM73515.1 hypothetical protein CDL15_Pgr026614 [Punica granatum]